MPLRADFYNTAPKAADFIFAGAADYKKYMSKFAD